MWIGSHDPINDTSDGILREIMGYIDNGTIGKNIVPMFVAPFLHE